MSQCAEHILPASAPERCCTAQGLRQHTLPPVKLLAGTASQVAGRVMVAAAVTTCCCCCCCRFCLCQHQPHTKLCKPGSHTAEGLRTQKDLGPARNIAHRQQYNQLQALPWNCCLPRDFELPQPDKQETAMPLTSSRAVIRIHRSTGTTELCIF